MRLRHLARFLVGSLCASLAFLAAAQAVSGTPSTVSEGDVSFMKHAASEVASQLRLSQLALEKSTNDRVINLAQRLVDSDTQAKNDLGTLADGEQVSLPTPSPDDDADLAECKQKDGDKFDQAWADAVVKQRQKWVAMFTVEKVQAKDPDVGNFADKALPVLGEQLQLAQTVQDALALSTARNGAMESHAPMANSAFDHVSTPIGAASASSAATASAPATSMGIH